MPAEKSAMAEATYTLSKKAVTAGKASVSQRVLCGLLEGTPLPAVAKRIPMLLRVSMKLSKSPLVYRSVSSVLIVCGVDVAPGQTASACKQGLLHVKFLHEFHRINSSCPQISHAVLVLP